jgi:imidazolonepropionase-like amidohydrolase
MREKDFACTTKTAPRFKLFVLALLTLALISSPSAHGQKSTLIKPLAITHVTVIDVTNAEVKPDCNVVIVGGRIAEIGPDKQVRLPQGAQTVNAKGRFLLPGLWDMHVHFGKAGEALFPSLLANGVTSVREMGGDGELALMLRERVKSGSLLGPRIKSAGLILESPQFIQLVERITGEAMAGKRIGVANADDAQRAIEAAVKMGADFLKIRTNASRASYLAIAAEAKRVGLPLVGHAPVGVSLLDASDAGQRSIEHGMLLSNNLSPDELKEIAARFVKNGTHVTPTLIAGRGFREMPDDEVLAIIDDKSGSRDARRKYVPQSLADFWRRQIEM